MFKPGDKVILLMDNVSLLYDRVPKDTQGIITRKSVAENFWEVSFPYYGFRLVYKEILKKITKERNLPNWF